MGKCWVHGIRSTEGLCKPISPEYSSIEMDANDEQGTEKPSIEMRI